MKKYILYGIGGLFVVIMLLGDGAALYPILFHKDPPATAAKASAHAKHAKKKPKRPPHGKPHFVKLKKFVVTLPHPNGGGQSYLQLSIEFLTYHRKAVNTFESYKPTIESAITSNVMAQSGYFQEHQTKARHRLEKQALSIANKLVHQADQKLGKAPFLGAYVTSFVMQ